MKKDFIYNVNANVDICPDTTCKAATITELMKNDS